MLKGAGTGDVTSASITKALDSGKTYQGFMAHDFACTHHSKLFPTPCNTYGRVFQFTGGKPVDQGQWYDSANPYSG